MEFEKKIEDLTVRVDAVLDYIEQNPESDPNAYEMMDLTIQVGRIGSQVKNYGERNELDQSFGYDFAINHEALSNLRKKYFDMMRIRLDDMVVDKNNLGLNEDSMLYKFLDESKRNIITYGGLVGDNEPERKEAMCKLAGVALYTKQRKRDLQRDGKSEIIYDNSDEFKQIQEYYKTHRPNLYEAGLLDEIERCYDKKFEPRQTGIKGLEGLVKSDEEVAESYNSQTTDRHIDREITEKDI